jgi:hypothetical protein
MNTKQDHISYWQYQDGWHYRIELLRKDKARAWEYSPEHVGWFCWAYPADDDEFREFIATLPSASAEHRFNGGDPMFTVFIRDKNCAQKFANKYKLKI